ncbi:hypothetical protein [Tepidibacter formicigenes]|jgi:uncharacterized protein (DUF983 family)|uniref:Uncharacterized protein n=1 Tax=Tepidibacter formicigenes DSM 15518 TaxID=1123349 RepID=A0A1M6MLZ4_9FIRM|nr:hypothetical protein [Tepidibacter formicigenes]SHJ84469.1 hypothetical protein SAMN02744037_00991 [Tepidibacter formicigenes DSM 15518]
MKIHYNVVVWIMLIIILMSIQYSINKVIVLLKDIKNILIQLKMKDRL